MKKWCITTAALFFVLLAAAQADTTTYPYKKFPTIPPFKLLQADSTYFTKEQLKKGPVLLMFFSPGCDHCQHQMGDIMKKIDAFHHAQIVLATYEKFEDMVEFISYFELAKHPNIKVGRDEKFFLPPFYHMQSLPYLAAYNKKGELVTTWQGNVPVDTVLKALE